MRKDYVIGLSQTNLLNIQWQLNTYECKTEICRIVHGFTCVYDATPFDDLNNARNTIKEIQNRYGQIVVRRDNIVESLVYGNDFDPMQLHIYEVRVGWEVK
jgi:hypothetical protein